MTKSHFRPKYNLNLEMGGGMSSMGLKIVLLWLTGMVPCVIGVKVLAFIRSHFDSFILYDKDKKR